MAVTKLQSSAWKQYGLNQDPFAAASNQPYIPAAWHSHLGLLHHLCLYSNVLMAVTAPSGYGKTTLLQQLRDQDDTLVTHTLVSDRSLDPAELMRNVLSAFQDDNQIDGERSLLVKSKRLLSELKATGKNYLLLIDDADLLPKQSLELCLHWVKTQTQEDAALHIFLAGRESLLQQIQSLETIQQNNSLLYAIELAPLNLAETENYIRHCFNVAGFRGDEPLSREAILAVHEASQGIFEEIPSALLAGGSESQPAEAYSFSLWDQYRLPFFAGTGLVVGLIVAYAVIKPWFGHGTHTTQIISRSLPLAPAAGNVLAQTNHVLSTTPTVNLAEQKIAEQPVKQGDQSAEVNLDQQNHSNMISQQAPAFLSSDSKTTQGDSAHPIIKQVLVPVHQGDAAPRSSNQNDDQTAHAIAPDDASNDPTAKQNNSQMQTEIAPATNQSDLGTQVTTPSSAAKVLQKTELTPSSYLQKTRRKQQNSMLINQHSFYAIQLLGTHNKAALIKFQRQYNLQNRTTYIKTQLNGEPWYSLILGKFNSRQQAIRELTRLPAQIGGQRPWVKEFGSNASARNNPSHSDQASE